MKAEIQKDCIAIQSHAIRPDVGQEFLTINCPNGWEDIQKLLSKVLLYNGKRFTYRSWNSDRNECFFTCEISSAGNFARIVK